MTRTNLFSFLIISLYFQYAALEEIIRPSNIRKRNFSASISTVLSETSVGNGTEELADNDLTNEDDQATDPPMLADLSRGAKIRATIFTVPPKVVEDRSRIWLKRTTAVPNPPRSSAIEKRGRVRLRSHMGNSQKVTTAIPRTEDGATQEEGEERAKRDRMRHLKIR